MYDCYRVPDDIAVRVDADVMRTAVSNIFRHFGTPEADARHCADSLIYADLRGIESHGISNMMKWYVKGLTEGWLNPAPKCKVVREAPGSATLDGDKGVGLAVGPQAMQLAIDKARECGVGAVSVTNSWHVGAVGYHASLALEHDMIGVAMTAAGIYTPPTFGSKPLLGTNPIAVAVPTQSEVSFVYDASTTSVAKNKVILTEKHGHPVPAGWIAKSDGTPIMEPGPLPEDYLLLPLGATREIGSHKGYGLSVIVEILGTMLSGNAPRLENPHDYFHHFMAYRVDGFTDVDTFKRHVDAYLKALRESPPAPGHDRVFYAGLPEHERMQENLARGIPYHPDVVAWHRQTAEELGVEHQLPDVAGA